MPSFAYVPSPGHLFNALMLNTTLKHTKLLHAADTWVFNGAPRGLNILSRNSISDLASPIITKFSDFWTRTTN